MKELKMVRLPQGDVPLHPLPQGYTFTTYQSPADIAPWANCCRQGIVMEGETDEEAWLDSVTKIPDIRPESDIFFLDHDGKHIGTVTAFVRSGTGAGEIHMVGLLPEYRGKGLGSFLANKAVHELTTRGVPYIALMSDETKPAALKSYLSAGFLPVEYAQGMQDRWESVLETLGIDRVQMLYEDFTPFREIERRGISKKIRIGVVGSGRGQSMMDYCTKYGNAELVAICDNFPPALARARRKYGDGITYYDDYETFLTHDMDAVVLANFANAHAPFAIRAMEMGKNVLSEVLPVQSMQEAVALCETVERTGLVYAYAENCCYMPSARKMHEAFREGRLGTFEYGEGEYMHNCEPDWDALTYGDPNHWRNTMSAFYYCTHSMGPMVHISGLRPVRVTGFEAPYNDRMRRMGAKGAPFGVMLVTMENGAVVKSLQGVGPAKNSTWFCVYGSKGRMESGREDDKEHGNVRALFENLDAYEGENHFNGHEADTNDAISEQFEQSGHGGADDYMMHHFIQKLRGNRNADVIDVYEALDMYLPGHFAYRSVLAGGMPVEIPDLRDPAQRDKWRSDATCTDPAAGENALPSYSKGNPDIPQETYDKLKEKLDKRDLWNQ